MIGTRSALTGLILPPISHRVKDYRNCGPLSVSLQMGLSIRGSAWRTEHRATRGIQSMSSSPSNWTWSSWRSRAAANGRCTPPRTGHQRNRTWTATAAPCCFIMYRSLWQGILRRGPNGEQMASPRPRHAPFRFRRGGGAQDRQPHSKVLRQGNAVQGA